MSARLPANATDVELRTEANKKRHQANGRQACRPGRREHCRPHGREASQPWTSSCSHISRQETVYNACLLALHRQNPSHLVTACISQRLWNFTIFFFSTFCLNARGKGRNILQRSLSDDTHSEICHIPANAGVSGLGHFQVLHELSK